MSGLNDRFDAARVYPRDLSQTLLSAAVDTHHVKRIIEIFETHLGLDPDLPVYDGSHGVLLYAAEKRELGLARYMLKKGADANRQADGRATPLMAAVWGDEAEAFVDLFLEHHADVGAVDTDGDTALHHAMSHWAPQNVVRKLVAAGSDPFLVNRYGRTAFHNGALSCNIESMKTLLSLMESRPDRNLAVIRNDITGKTLAEELQEQPDHLYRGEGWTKRTRMLAFLSAYTRQKIQDAARRPTQQPLPALRKIGRKP